MGEPYDIASVTAQLERILQSPRLESSPSLSLLLRFIVQETLAGRTATLKEYSLGVEVFGRGEAFDPRLDPIVRVQARNLRTRLAEYYDSAGAEDRLLIELPKRTYVPIFQTRADPAPQPEPVTAPVTVTPGIPVEPVRRNRAAVLVAMALLLALFAAAFWLIWPRGGMAAEHQPDSVALDLFIRARQMVDRQTEPSLRAAIETLNQAIRHDSQFAAAQASLAEAYNMLAQFGYIAPADGMVPARRAAETAIAINPNLADGHVALASVLEAYDWNWPAAEREYRLALRLNPLMPSAHLWYGMYLRDQGRTPEAMVELRRAAQLDPYSVSTSVNLAHGFLLEGNYAAAEQEARRASEKAPDLITPYVILASAASAQSQPQQAEAALDRARGMAGEDPHALATLARTLARRGRSQESQALYDELETLAQRRYVSPYDLGTVLLALGNEEKALTQLEEAFRQRSSGLIFLRTAKFADRTQASRFRSLVEKMRFAG
jgi:tetratricopeptide (TPR) repeat protein